jgi:plastocyanin
LRSIHRPLIGLATLAVALTPAAAAQAAGKTVSAGPHKQVKNAPEAGDVNAYFPAKIKVAKGGTVTFKINGFHDVYFGKAPGLVAPDPAHPIDQKDAAGNAFWFNGQPRLTVNGSLFAKLGDGKVDGTKSVDASGLPPDEGAPPPFKVKFTKVGTYTYYCDVHPGMKGQVTVINKGKKVPSPKADLLRADVQLAKAIKTLKENDVAVTPGGSSVLVGNDTKDTALFKFFGSPKVKVGEPVTFSMPGTSAETHNVALGPEAYLKAQSDGTFAPDASTTPPAFVLNPLVFLPSDSPSAFPAYSSTLHGNGFLNTGALDTDAATPNPAKATIAFSAPGTYTFYCLIHYPDMKGTVEVTQ